MKSKDRIPARKIAELIFEGLANKEIGVVLNKSKRTVDDYIHRLLKKHHCTNRAQLANKILGAVGST